MVTAFNFIICPKFGRGFLTINLCMNSRCYKSLFMMYKRVQNGLLSGAVAVNSFYRSSKFYSYCFSFRRILIKRFLQMLPYIVVRIVENENFYLNTNVSVQIKAGTFEICKMLLSVMVSGLEAVCRYFVRWGFGIVGIIAVHTLRIMILL